MLAESCVMVLALNNGSSSLKFSLFRVQSNAPDPLLEGLRKAAAIGQRMAHGGPLLRRCGARETLRCAGLVASREDEQIAHHTARLLGLLQKVAP